MQMVSSLLLVSKILLVVPNETSLIAETEPITENLVRLFFEYRFIISNKNISLSLITISSVPLGNSIGLKV